jgi:hypothetical protein
VRKTGRAFCPTRLGLSGARSVPPSASSIHSPGYPDHMCPQSVSGFE